MANTDNAFGLRPYGYLSGACWNGALNKYYIPSTDSTAVYVGGLVKLAGSGDSDGIPSVTANVSAKDVVVGVVNGIVGDADDALYGAGSTDRYILVCDDPAVAFEVQEDSDTSTLAATNIGQNADLTGLTSGSTTTGRSSIEIDSDTAETTATLDVQILRLVNRPDNVIGDNAKWIVKLNNHQFVDGTTGV